MSASDLEPQTIHPIPVHPDEAPHRPADDTEDTYFDGSPLIRGAVLKAIGWELLGLALILAPWGYIFLLQRTVHHFVLAGFALAGLALLCIPGLWAMTVKYRITNYRIDWQRGLLNRDIDTLELWHIEDISYHQTIPDRLLGLGTITVISHDVTTPRLILHSLPHSRRLFDQLKQRIIAVKRQRGVLKIDSGT